MIFFLALIPATVLTVAGYFVLFLAHRSEGGLRTFGRYLGVWAFVLAGLVVLGGMFAAGHMHREHPGMWGMHGPRHPWMDYRDGDREGPPPPPEGAPAPPPGGPHDGPPPAPPAPGH
jgi:hypothetical protein